MHKPPPQGVAAPGAMLEATPPGHSDCVPSVTLVVE
jgi:hypothetical protein